MASEEDVQHIRAWLSSQHHLPTVSDGQLELFFHSCSYCLEQTKKTIETYYTVKTNAPEFFSNRDVLNAEIQHIKNVVQLAVLPRKSPEGHTVIVGRLRDVDPSHYFPNSTIKLLFMVIDACLQVEGPLSGLVYVFDMQGAAVGHATKHNFSSLKKYFLYSQEGMPAKVKAIHVLNVNTVMSYIMNIIKQFMSKERLKLIHLHTGIPDKFLQAIPQNLLPSDYNGDEPSLDKLFDDTMMLLEKFQDWFRNDEKLRVDESKPIPTKMATLQVTTEEKFTKNVELKQDDLDELRKWISSKPHMPPVSDEQLIQFLHSCYYNVSDTKDCITAYYRLRADSSDLFTERDLDLPDNKNITSVLNYVELPIRDENGYRIIFHSLKDPDPSKFMFSSALKVFFMMVDGCLVHDGTSPGVVFLLDAAGLRFGHIMRLNLSLIRRGLAYLQEGMPVRLKAIHILNSAFAVDQVMVILKPFMNRKLYNMINFHKGNNETIYKFLPKKCLPKEYGGELSTVAELHDKSIAQLKLLANYFKEEENQRTLDLTVSAVCALKMD